MRVWYIDATLKIKDVHRQGFGQIVKEPLLGFQKSSQRLLGGGSITLHTCKVKGCVHAVQVEGCDNRLSGQPDKDHEDVQLVQHQLGNDLSAVVGGNVLSSPVSSVAGVVEPHEFVETVAPPGGQVKSNVEGALSLWDWVPPTERITLNLFLQKRDTVNKVRGKKNSCSFFPLY